ncbi:MAG: hypothetical protein Q9225_000159 [Loekoesia sp. 1 TL-2023]
MTPLPATEDAPDSLLSPTGSKRSLPDPRDRGEEEVPSHPILVNIESTPTSVAPSVRSSSRHSQSNREPEAFYGVRSLSPLHSKAPSEDLRETILASFSPRVAFLASEDTDDIAKEKGFARGFYNLLRPFGEQVLGKVVVRDSVGASKAWENFGIRLIQYEQVPRAAALSTDHEQSKQQDDSQAIGGEIPHSPSLSAETEGKDPVDAILNHSLRSARTRAHDPFDENGDHVRELQAPGKSSSAYLLYLRKLLSEAFQGPYETFSHPVACIIAVSSRSQGPLETIRQLYSASGRANAEIPPWVGVDYLHYYVLVHDEDRDDVTKSTALFDLMKRHFGLHCYLLRIRSGLCAETDNDSFRMPQSEWRSAAEEQMDLENSDLNSGLDAEEFIFESDATAIRSFIREMVTQSLVPYMESRIVTWNDQVASKRRGIGGRFMSLSKKWTNFGSSKGSNSTTNTGPNPSSSNYDPARGYYLPEAPEAIMRQLADYAFMLRDFKMALSTYESLRTDFSSDKAWLYHASASELAVVSYLLIPQTLSNRSRSEMVDQKLDAALYSYLARCSMPSGAVRALILTFELLIGRGPAAADDATKWATRLLDLGILTPLQQALITERVSDVHGMQSGLGLLGLGSRRRHALLWNTLVSKLWVKLDRPVQASFRLQEARTIMEGLSYAPDDIPFPTMAPLFSIIAKEARWTRSETVLQLSSTTTGNHDDNTMYETNERLGQNVLPVEPGAADAGGFSTIDADHSGFDTDR